MADAARTIQVLGNLLSNAIKFTPRDGEIRIGFEATASRPTRSVCGETRSAGVFGSGPLRREYREERVQRAVADEARGEEHEPQQVEGIARNLEKR